MDPASIFIIIVVVVGAAAVAAFLFLTGAGLELREGRRGRRQRRPEHARVENEQHTLSLPVRSQAARSSASRSDARAQREAK